MEKMTLYSVPEVVGRARGQVRIRHRTSNPEIEGSNPPGLAKISKENIDNEKRIL